MSTTVQTTKIELSSSDAAIVVRALGMLRASLERAQRSEFSDEVRALRQADVARVAAIAARFGSTV